MSTRRLGLPPRTRVQPFPPAIDAEPERVNVYTCERCKRQLVTIDRHQGVTPMFMRCDPVHTEGGCGARMRSAMYPKERPIPARIGPPTHEWYTPIEAERKRLARIPGMIDHVVAGGLVFRPIIADETAA